MTVDRINRIVLASLLSISVFIFLDCFVFPLQTSKGVVVTKTEQKISRLRVSIFRIGTEKHILTVAPITYRNAEVNDTIEIRSSYVTHVLLKMKIYRKGEVYNWRIGFISLGGLDYLILVVIANGAYLFFFYQKIKRPRIRRDLTIFLTVVSGIFFLFYFLFE
ncbi:MAG: hypothetical protein ABI581_06820 [Sediminibacterium sp.]